MQTARGDLNARSCLEESAFLRQKVVIHAVRAAWGENHELINIFAKKRRINGEK
jgi:hypothetical protein